MAFGTLFEVLNITSGARELSYGCKPKTAWLSQAPQNFNSHNFLHSCISDSALEFSNFVPLKVNSPFQYWFLDHTHSSIAQLDLSLLSLLDIEYEKPWVWNRVFYPAAFSEQVFAFCSLVFGNEECYVNGHLPIFFVIAENKSQPNMSLSRLKPY